MANSDFTIRDALGILAKQYPMLSLRKLTVQEAEGDVWTETWALYVGQEGEALWPMYSRAASPAEAIFAGADSVVRTMNGGAWQLEFEMGGVA